MGIILLNTVNFSSFIKSGIPHILFGLQNENIALPSLPEQQQRICLSSLDEAIERQAEKIEQLKIQGLMQGSSLSCSIRMRDFRIVRFG